MLNKVIAQGRLIAEPDLRYTKSQTPVVSFSLAVERDFKGDDGKRQTDFINCVAWRSTAEFVSKYFHKGDMSVISGRLQSQKYADKNGTDRMKWEVLIENIYFAANRKKERSEKLTPNVSADDFDDGEPQDWKQNTPLGANSNYYQSDEQLPF